MGHRNIEFRRINFKNKFFRDLFYWSLKLSWPKLILYIFIYFIILNLFFALLYSIPGQQFSPNDLSFLDRFFFSVHTFSTVGYGSISPIGYLSNLIVTVEIFIGLLSVALITGLMFAKFSQPKSFIEFSSYLLITEFRGKRSLVFRMVNDRFADVINMNIYLETLVNETTKEGIKIKNIQNLQLKKPFLPMFVAAYTGVHVIDESSPLKDINFEQMVADNMEFFISVEGIDTTTNELITGKHWYNKHHLVKDKLFEDMLIFEKDGVRTIDYSKLDILK